MNVPESFFSGSHRPLFAWYFFRIYSNLVSIVGNMVEKDGSLIATLAYVDLFNPSVQKHT